MHPFVKIFMIVWFSFLGVFSVIMLISAFAGQADIQGSPVLGPVIPAGMAAFGVALVKFGRWLGRSEETAIIAFLKNTLETNDAAEPLWRMSSVAGHRSCNRRVLWRPSLSLGSLGARFTRP